MCLLATSAAHNPALGVYHLHSDTERVFISGSFMDCATPKILSWRLSNTLDTKFCLEALDEAISKFGLPKIFDTDQGSQFTSLAFTSRLQQADITISMDGRGRYLDNSFIERL